MCMLFMSVYMDVRVCAHPVFAAAAVCVCVQRASLPLQNRADAVLTFRQKHKLGLLKEQL